VYLTSAFLAFLYFLSERRMNNLRVCNGLDGSIPTAPAKTTQSQRLIAAFNNNKPFNNN
jgi:hypothetical protein